MRKGPSPPPAVEVTSCQEEPYMNMDNGGNRRIDKNFLHTSHQPSSQFTQFGRKEVLTLPRDGRILSQMMQQRNRQPSAFIPPTLQQLQHHQLAPPAGDGPDGYIRMARADRVTFEDRSRTRGVEVLEGNYINSPKHPVSIMREPKIPNSGRVRSKSLESILSVELEPPNRYDHPHLPPRPSIRMDPLLNRMDYSFTHHNQQEYASPRSYSHLLGNNWNPQSHDNHETLEYHHNSGYRESGHSQHGQISKFNSTENTTRATSSLSGYATMPRHPNRHGRSITAPTLSISTADNRKIPPPVPPRSESSNTLLPHKSSQRFTQNIDEYSHEHSVTCESTYYTPSSTHSANTSEPSSAQPPQRSPQFGSDDLLTPNYPKVDNDDDDDVYDDLKAPPYDNSNKDVPSIPVPAMQDNTDQSPPMPAMQDDTDQFPPMPAMQDATDQLPPLPMPAVQDDIDQFPPPPTPAEVCMLLHSIQVMSVYECNGKNIFMR